MREFHDRFNIEVGVAEAQRRFVNRSITVIFGSYLPSLRQPTFRLVRRSIVAALGEIERSSRSIEDYIDGDFTKALIGLEAAWRAAPEYNRHELTKGIQELLATAETDLNVRWTDGKFLPAGAKELDDELINGNLRWLRDASLSAVRMALEKALRHLLEAHRRPDVTQDVVTDAYESLEALAKHVTGRDADLSANREMFLKKAGKRTELASVLKEYIKYANRYRHAPRQTPRRMPTVNEAESFVYLTGIFIRLASDQHSGSSADA